MPELAGADAPNVVAEVSAPTSAPAPDAPAVSNAEVPPGEQQPEKPTRTYTEDEHRRAIQERLGKERRSLERRIRAEVERDYLKQQLETRKSPEPSKAEGEPRQQDYPDYESWILARAKHELKKELAQQHEQRERETTQERQQREHVERAQRIRDIVEAAKEKYEDIEEIISGNVPYTQPMVAYFEDSERAGDLMYHLGTNAKEAARIAQLSPAGQFRELVKLEAKLSAPPRPTQTPAPITPAAGPSRSSKDWSEMSTAEHVEAYRKRKQRSS